MSFELRHTLVSGGLAPVRQTSGGQEFFSVNLTGEFLVLFPGPLTRKFSASFLRQLPPALEDPLPIDEPDDGSVSLDSPPSDNSKPLQDFDILREDIPLTLRIFTPDRQEFTGNEITLAHLEKFRDLRGRPLPWSYTVKGEGRRVDIIAGESLIGRETSSLSLSVIETVASESAAPLVKKASITKARAFKFDLFRLGTFVAEISQQAGAKWRGLMRLLDPDGVVVAHSKVWTLSFTVDLRTLNKSRDAAGHMRPWTLEVTPMGVVDGSPRLSATVIGQGRITIAALTSRIEALLGKHGEFVEILGENKDGYALARLKINDVASAETIDMYGLLDSALERVEQDSGVNPFDFEAYTAYTLARMSEDLGFGLDLDVKDLRVETIDVEIGPGDMLGASVPAVRLTVAVSGAVRINFAGQSLVEATVKDGKFAIEVGIKLAPDGTPEMVKAVPDSPFEFDFSDGVKGLLLLTLGPWGLIAGMTVEEFGEHEINNYFAAATRNLLPGSTLAPRILMTIFGAHLAYKPFRVEGDEIVFDYIAPLERESKPSSFYHGAIGRKVKQVTPQSVTFLPPALGDTWVADNLNKIDHIVVVMMENRSYDHVLGYRANETFNDGADGLTSKMMAAIEKAPQGTFEVRGLREAGFAPNPVGKMTRLPMSVGHELEDVTEQLNGGYIKGPHGKINSPKGFVANFKRIIDRVDLEKEPHKAGVVKNDVLGFYDEKDLPFYAYLAENYAYCDRYFCSHPGPTLPNRMYSLTGDVQHDRYGFPILDNNNGDNFLLSRAPTIYDLLTRKGLTFRVYESFPSVTMLRMFARYATDTTNIVPFTQLTRDVKHGDLPAFTVIEPAMHDHAQNDDHPDADMHRGQMFLRDVYTKLRSNQKLWEKTLLIITYDEHGGFYDHVIPPVADVLQSGVQPLPSGSAVTVIGTIKPPAPESLLKIPYGVRVPTFLVSPWVTRGKGASIVLDHCSILKSVLARFFVGEKPFVSDRVSASHSFDAFLTEAAPRTVPDFDDTLLPALSEEARRTISPTTSTVIPPLSRQEMREGPVDFHRLTARWARQLGR